MLAHELTHIIDRDTRLLIVTIVFVGMISFLAQILWSTIRFGAFTRGRSRRGGGVFILVAIAAIAIVRRVSARAGPALCSFAKARDSWPMQARWSSPRIPTH